MKPSQLLSLRISTKISTMKTAILQVSFLLNTLFHLSWSSHFQQAITSRQYQQCGQEDQPVGWDHHIFNMTYLHTPLPDTRIFQHYRKEECPSLHSFYRSGHSSAQHQSLCPWTHIRNYDPNRFPMEMFYARCSCRRCASWDRSGFRHECRPHYHAFNVIRRVCDGGRYKFYHAHEYFPIACVCSHEHVHFL